ncbi:MAG: hypothetical protein O2968_21610 [Acidobacteria bacterium]|nr:hypothetical protein [Acidobacteriota bacterium]
MKLSTLIQVIGTALATAAHILAQPVVTPTPDKPDEIKNVSAYTISNSFEAGYRMSDVSGNQDVYRSSINYGSGVRLFEGQLRINSKEGTGAAIDELSFYTLGAGDDPYQATRLRLEKNRWFRYDMQLRVNQYFNQLPSLWNGERAARTERTFQNHDLILFPSTRFEVILGYDRNSQAGPGFFTENTATNFGAFDDENFLRFSNDIRRENNQYRAGFNARVAGLAITFVQAFDNYKEDPIFGDASTLSLISPNVQQVSSVRRDEPIHGNTPVTTVAIRTEKERKLGFQARYVYAGGNRNFILSEDITAFDAALSTSSLRQTFVFGDADRKQGNGDFSVVFMPTERWTISNTTSVNNTRIGGDSVFLELTSNESRLTSFEFLGIRHITNASEVNFRPHRTFGLYGAYRFSRRRIQTRENFLFPGGSFATDLFEQSNDIKSAVGGFRWFPVSGLRVSFDAEVGKAELPFTPRSDKDFHSETLRAQYRKKGFTLGGSFKSRDNSNAASLINHSSQSRHWSVNGSWTEPDGRLMFDAGYTKLEIDTASGIFNFFGEADPVSEARTFYTSNLNTLYFTTRILPHKRATVYLGYNIARDTGDGRGTPVLAAGFEPAYPNFSFDGTNFYSSFPLTYQSPSARLSISLHERLSWNFGWQFYNYDERFTGDQNYHAHVSYSSFRWSF